MVRIDQAVNEVVVAAVQRDMAQCSVTVRDDIMDAHAVVLTRLALPGDWWTGAERVAIAATARAARNCAYCVERKAALSPYSVSGVHKLDPDVEGLLPAALVDIIHFATSDASRMTESAINKLVEDGISDAHYVEALGIAVAIRSIDQTCRGLGVPLHPLPNPIAGDPSRIRPEVEPAREAFVPMMPAAQPVAPNDDLWDADSIFYGLRALSLVPDAVRDLLVLSAAQYLPMDIAGDFSQGRTLGREQMELLAGRVSSINDCFY